MKSILLQGILGDQDGQDTLEWVAIAALIVLVAIAVMLEWVAIAALIVLVAIAVMAIVRAKAISGAQAITW
jgi:hypothetical protein